MIADWIETSYRSTNRIVFDNIVSIAAQLHQFQLPSACYQKAFYSLYVTDHSPGGYGHDIRTDFRT